MWFHICRVCPPNKFLKVGFLDHCHSHCWWDRANIPFPSPSHFAFPSAIYEADCFFTALPKNAMSSLWIFSQQEGNYGIACISLMCEDMIKGNLPFFFCDLFILHLDVVHFFKSAYFRPFVFLICYCSSHCWLSLQPLYQPPTWTPCLHPILTQQFCSLSLSLALFKGLALFPCV